MNRKIFFWLAKLKISRTERRAISYLLILLAIFAILNLTITRGSPFDEAYYKPLDEQFRARTAAMKQDRLDKMARYEGRSLPLITADTTDSTTNEFLPGTLININTADAMILQKLDGIGSAYAQRIIAYRQKYGVFTTKEELLKIKGIGPVRLERIRQQIVLGEIYPDSQKISRPPVDQSPSEKLVTADSANEQQTININKADAQLLQQLPGVGPVYARRIIEYRQKNGPFKSTEELIEIKGIGKKRLAKIKPFIKLKAQQ